MDQIREMNSEGRRRFRTRLVETDREGNLEEFLYDDGESATVAVLAPNGGAVEPNTDTQALMLAEQFDGVVCWGTRGYAQGSAFNRWHRPSNEFSPSEFRLLDEIVDREFETVISFQSMAAEGVVLGGSAPEGHKHVVQAYLWEQELDVVLSDEGPYGGVHPESVVNRVAGESGWTYQLEQGLGVVGECPELVVGGLATWLSDQKPVGSRRVGRQ